MSQAIKWKIKDSEAYSAAVQPNVCVVLLQGTQEMSLTRLHPVSQFLILVPESYRGQEAVRHDGMFFPWELADAP